MKKLEIISIRTAGHRWEQARQYLQEIRQTLQNLPTTEMQFYINADVSGDLAVILSWTSKQIENSKSDLGLSLASAMKRFGLVEHACWLAIDNQS